MQLGKLVDMYTGSDRHIHGRIGTGRRRMEDAARQVARFSSFKSKS
jgi:hypothetical protein